MALEELEYLKTIAEHKTFLMALDALGLKKYDEYTYNCVKSTYWRFRKKKPAKFEKQLEFYKNILI